MPQLANQDAAWSAGLGFLRSRDPAAAAKRILLSVQAGKLLLSRDGIAAYATAAASTAAPDHLSPTLADRRSRDLYQLIMAAYDKAQIEILDALVTANGPGTPHHVEVLWTAFEVTVPIFHYGKHTAEANAIRVALAKRQLELPTSAVRELLGNWKDWGDPDFLPLVRREAGLPKPDPTAVAILEKLESKQPGSSSTNSLLK